MVGVNAVCNSIIISHIQSIFDVCASILTTPGYGGFNSTKNPICDPATTISRQFATMDQDPGSFRAPDTSVFAVLVNKVILGPTSEILASTLPCFIWTLSVSVSATMVDSLSPRWTPPGPWHLS